MELSYKNWLSLHNIFWDNAKLHEKNQTYFFFVILVLRTNELIKF